MATLNPSTDLNPNNLNPEIFVSYCRRDKEFVRSLCDALQHYQRSPWVDWQDIPPSADWRQEIRTGILTAHTFLFVISPDSIVSKECLVELDYAIQHHKRLMPVVCQEVKAEQVHPALASLNWIFFREKDDFDHSLTTLLQALDTDIEYVQAHTRLLLRAADWENNGHDQSLLLHGRSLVAVEQWLVKSGDREPRPSQLQREFVAASRLSETSRQRIVLASVTLALIVTSVLGLITFQQYRSAEASRKEAVTEEIKALSASSNALFTLKQEFQALIQGLRAGRQLQAATWLDPETRLQVTSTLGKAVYFIREHNRLEGHTSWIRQASFSPDGQTIATASGDRTIKLWKRDGTLLHTLEGHTDGV
ncbi:MAG: TIR domain-containing protein, partial [Phormidesmis sp. CAN_BIN44]|nr:TIR domain-containing protein [Phormidesmis sp. CAN_BIN44]